MGKDRSGDRAHRFRTKPARHLTPDAFPAVLMGRWQVAEELGRVEAGQAPRTEHDAETMHRMLKALDEAIANYRKCLR